MFSTTNTELSVKSTEPGGTQSLENKCTASLAAGHCLCQLCQLLIPAGKPHGRVWQCGFAQLLPHWELFLLALLFFGFVRTWNTLRALRFVQDKGFSFLLQRGWALWQKQ